MLHQLFFRSSASPGPKSGSKDEEEDGLGEVQVTWQEKRFRFHFNFFRLTSNDHDCVVKFDTSIFLLKIPSVACLNCLAEKKFQVQDQDFCKQCQGRNLGGGEIVVLGHCFLEGLFFIKQPLNSLL